MIMMYFTSYNRNLVTIQANPGGHNISNLARIRFVFNSSQIMAQRALVLRSFNDCICCLVYKS